MKAAAVLLFIIFLTTGALAQSPALELECPDVLIQDYAWGVTRRTSSNSDPNYRADTGGKLNTKDNPINSVGNPVNMVGVPINTAPVRPQGAPPAGLNPGAGSSSEMVQNIVVRRETYLLVKNSGNKIIRTVDWDYVFFTDASMEHELKRNKFHSKKKIAPGEVKFLSEYVSKHAASKYQKVFVNRVEFADKSIWQRP
jgi:hypothetical protein